ncbi:hypothetical protein EWM64_g7353 [Hericium alpestre]|uniref:Uncharacterized protein n=1 Tax=Hericium alpestre TaxID=135208 RepID=A0A4Y9ZT52_9AGAM|nr:hypothetical protein EWM64_g7353 [Hericium alpestre]
MPQLSDEYLMPFTEEFRRKIAQTMAFGWLVDENKLCQIALTSDGKYQGLVKWTKEYEDEQRKSNRWSDEDVLSEKTADLHVAIYRKMLQIKRKYTRPDSHLSDMSFCRVWIATRMASRGSISARPSHPSGPIAYSADAGVDPSEGADFWFYMNAFPDGNVEVDRVDADCEKILKPLLFLDPSCEPDGAGADEAEGSGTKAE